MCLIFPGFPQSCIYRTVIQIQESDSIHPACQRYRQTICSRARFAANLFFERPENKEIHQDIALPVIVSITGLIDGEDLSPLEINGVSRQAFALEFATRLRRIIYSTDVYFDSF